MAIGFRQVLIVILVAAAVWYYKRRARRNRQAAVKKRSPSQAYQDTVRCRNCGVYLPRADARGDPEHGYLCPDPACRAHSHSPTGSTG